MGLLACVLTSGQTALALDPDKAFHQYVTDRWSIEQGLPQVTVQAIAQDAEGYLWFGTQVGAGRFDGVRFTQWSPQTQPGFPGELVNALALGDDGRLWIGAYRGLAHYSAGMLQAVPRADGEPVEILSLLPGKGGQILAGTVDGVATERDGQLVPWRALPGPAHALARHQGEVWVGSRGGVYRLAEGQEPGWVPINPYPGAGVRVSHLVAESGRLWAGTSVGLFVLDPAAARPEWRQVTDSPVVMLYADRDGNLWVGALDGLRRMQAEREIEFVARGAAGSLIEYRSAFEDREGNLWLGSRAEGVMRAWNGWTTRYAGPEGLTVPIVWSLAPGALPGEVWVGSDNGLFRLADGRYQAVLSGSQLPHPNAYTLLAEPDRLWVGTRRGLAALALPEQRLETLPERFLPMAEAQINGMLRDRQGRLWFATDRGVMLDDGDRVQRFELGSAAARVLFESADGSLYVGSTRGLWRFDGERFVAEGEDQGLPREIDVLSITQLGDGRLLLGLLAEQVFVRDRGRWSGFGVAQGLPKNSPFFMAEDGAGFLWMAGIRGITRVPLSDLQDVARDPSRTMRGETLLNERGTRFSGQQGYCCNGAGNAKGFVNANVLWLPTRDGIVTMDMKGVVKNPIAPRVKVERYRVDHDWNNVLPDVEPRLPLGRRDLTLEFTALSFQDPLSVSLEFRLLGYDTQWQTVDDPLQRDARYTNLPPGRYRFEVRAANNAGVWNPQAAQFAFVVPPQLIETLGFRLALLALMAMMVILSVRWKVGSLERRRLALEHIVEQRTEALAQVNRQLVEASRTDPLTGVSNRRAVYQRLPQRLSERSEGSGDTGLVLVLIDLDHFKSINDRYGHAAGDRVLQHMATLLGRFADPAAELIARWGGEEFLLVFEAQARGAVALLLERLRESLVAERFDLADGTALRLTASFGFVEMPSRLGGEAVLNWERWLELADDALYRVKASGRDGWAGYRPTQWTQAEKVSSGARPDVQTLVAEGQLQWLSSIPAPRG